MPAKKNIDNKIFYESTLDTLHKRIRDENDLGYKVKVCFWDKENRFYILITEKT